MDRLVENNLEKLFELCKTHYVEYMALFGSATANVKNEKSDIDLLVRFSPDLELLNYAENYFSLRQSLEQLFKRQVDLVSEKSLRNPVLIESINEQKVLLYAA